MQGVTAGGSQVIDLSGNCNNPDSKPPRGYHEGTIIRYSVIRNEGYRVIAFDGPAKVPAVAAFNPVLGLTAMPHRASMITGFLGGKCKERMKLCREASPITHAGRSAAPILILHGTADHTVPYQQATAMVDKLKAAGAAAELFTASDGAHTFWSTPKWYEASEKAMTDFLFRFAAAKPMRP